MPNEELPAALRRDRISALIRERGFVRVAELSRIFRTSPVTVRSDLDQLEHLHLVRRVHGGAISVTGTPGAAGNFSTDPKREAKSAIGALAASLVMSGQTVVLSSGTTTQAVARALARREELSDLTVVTNGLQIATELQPAVPRFTLIVTGGTLRADFPALIDPLADFILGTLYADVAVAGCEGISLTGGVTGDHVPSVAMWRRLLEAGRRRVIVADSTKVGATSVARFYDADEIDVLITEEASDPSSLADLRNAGVEVETVQ